jgi:hypothetical protein
LTGPPAWEDLVATALLGTERRPYDGTGVPPGLRRLAGVESDLLAAASAVWAYRESGRVPATGDPVADEAVRRDERPLAPPGALRTLTAILEDRRYRPVLGEWLKLAARKGVRLPGEMVPALLAACRPGERKVVAEVAGAIGGWLGARNPEWAWAADVTPGAELAGGPNSEAGDRDLIARIRERTITGMIDLLRSRPAPWSPALTAEVLSSLGDLVATGDLSRAGGVRDALPAIALAADPGQGAAAASLPEALGRVPEVSRSASRMFWERRLWEFAATVRFRQAMHQELR